MITEQKESFIQLFDLEENLASEQLKKARKKAWDHLLSLKLPDRKSDAYEYINLKSLYAERFSKALGTLVTKDEIQKQVLPESKNSHIVLVNGYYQKELSDTSAMPSSFVISTIEQAMRTFGTFLTNAWTKALKDEKHIFTVLNSARFQEGIFLYVPPKMVVPCPLQIISIVKTDDERSWIMPRVNLFQSASSEFILVNTHVAQSQNRFFYNQTLDVTLEENAKLTLIQDDLVEEANLASYIFDDLRVEMKRDAKFISYQLNSGASTTRKDLKVKLQGENSACQLNGVFLLDQEKELHTNVVIEHEEPHTQSEQLFKGVLLDSARSSFQGKIHVHQKAQKTEAYQLNNNLVLGDNAQANSKPNLEILADDVKASHGATAGKLEEEELFYLKSRGLSLQDAKGMLIQGFCGQVLENIPLTSIQEKGRAFISKFVKKCE